MGPLRDNPPEPVDFFEVAPENWIGIGGKMGKDLRYFTERYPFVAPRPVPVDRQPCPAG